MAPGLRWYIDHLKSTRDSDPVSAKQMQAWTNVAIAKIEAGKTAAIVTTLQHQQREEQIRQIERWMFFEFLENSVSRLAAHPERAYALEGNPDRYSAVYIFSILQLRDFARDIKQIHDSLDKLVSIDGDAGAAIAEEIEGHKKRALKAMREMFQSLAKPVPRSFKDLDALLIDSESRVARALLTRFWAKAIWGPVIPTASTVNVLVSELVLQQQRSQARVEELRRIYNVSRNGFTVQLHYEALIKKTLEGN